MHELLTAAEQHPAHERVLTQLKKALLQGKQERSRQRHFRIHEGITLFLSSMQCSDPRRVFTLPGLELPAFLPAGRNWLSNLLSLGAFLDGSPSS